MRDLTLQDAAKALGLTRPALIKRMREAELLNEKNLPTHPLRDRLYLRIHEGSWMHEKFGMQYTQSTRVRPTALRWLEQKLGIQRDLPPAEQDRRDVG
ncbi:DNA-binding protein [Pseudomonas citronellolis]|uniref:DNA-binding protein n=1 Tax=Pseudomonas citronellolis TaxID=53408 RepID=A0AAW6P6Q4_9PSED|nr:phage antirepressor KilAC domain-containing protein [Pseudomonas citronellolis]MDF3842692.1 DNA-binding protein [Pseudomonas citronellolis]